MANLLSYCGLVDARIRASNKDLPVIDVFLGQLIKLIQVVSTSESFAISTFVVIEEMVSVLFLYQLDFQREVLFPSQKTSHYNGTHFKHSRFQHDL